MLIIPAIDLRDGCVVRLSQGKFNQEKVYSLDPVKTAKHWKQQGAKLLHIVDLDGASTGALKSLEIIKKILADVPVPLELGGGIRKIETIGKLVDCGISRVILGTKAAQDLNFAKKAFKNFKNKVIVSIDAKEGLVMIRGWLEGAKKLKAAEFANQLKEIGFKELIYTDISQDGTLKGPNIKGLKTLLKETGLKIIASGGVSSLGDIAKLKALENDGLSGIIIGKALYEGKFTLTEASKI